MTSNSSYPLYAYLDNLNLLILAGSLNRVADAAADATADAENH